MNAIIKKIASVLVSVLLCISVGLCAIVIVSTVTSRDGSAFGFRVFYLVSGSMEPTIPTGAAVLVHKEASYEVGDVITFISSDAAIAGHPNTHRIVSVTEVNGSRAYVTKGDANSVEDREAVTADVIYGRVTWHTGKALWLGTLIGVLTTPLGFATMIFLPIMVVIACLMRSLTKEYKEAIQEEAQRRAAQEQNAYGAPPEEREPQAEG